jgi:formylglycine-generating enzyme required for sulfatase activity
MKLRKNYVFRALQGGSYVVDPLLMRVTYRNWRGPVLRRRYYGFRFVIRGKVR